MGPGSFSGIRISLSIAKGIKISKGAQIFGYKDSQLAKFDLKNIEILIEKNLLENKLIKPIYIS
jgi:tRNA A37 threonylcarbamoyladenosine modification protein TsaB